MSVSFPYLKNEKAGRPKSVKAPCFSSAHSRYVFLLRLFLEGRTPALPSPLYRSKLVNKSFPISSAKVLQIFDICKFFSRKIAKYVVKHKKSTSKGANFYTLHQLRW